jgi:hypothetical protein
VAIGLWECQSGPSVQPKSMHRNYLGESSCRQSQSEPLCLWKSREKCTKSKAIFGIHVEIVQGNQGDNREIPDGLPISVMFTNWIH